MKPIATIFAGGSDENEQTNLTLTHITQIGTRGGGLRYTSIPINQVSGIRFQRTENRGLFIAACVLAAFTVFAWLLRYQAGMGGVIIFGLAAAICLWCYYASRQVALQVKSSSTTISVLVGGTDETKFREFAQKIEEIQSQLVDRQAKVTPTASVI